MAVIAPPRQPDSRDVESTVEPGRGGEALIEEAKQHATRRRRRIAVTAIVASVAVAGAVAAALVAGASVISSSESSSTDAEAEVPRAGAAAVEPVDVVTSWAGYKRGWVMVFSDGRVVRWPANEGILEVQLSPAGLDVVESGRVTAYDVWRDTAFWVWPDDSEFDRHGWWADQNRRAYLPTQFAACSFDAPEDISLVARFLPNAVADMVAGTQRSVSVAAFEQVGFPAEPVPEECFVLSPEQVSAIAALTPARLETAHSDQSRDFAFPSSDRPRQSRLTKMSVAPMMPDGSIVLWGG